MRSNLFLLPIFLFTPLLYAQDNKLADLVELVETRHEIPKIKASGPYNVKDKTGDIELSEYAGYSGLIVANGGLKPNENSYFTKKHGFKVNITLSEEDSWSALNSGRLGVSAHTVDVVAALGKQFDILVPALIGYSRGADGIVVTKDIKKLNDLKGKVLTTSQFSESEFFLRYLAGEAGLKVSLLDDITQKPNPDTVNLVFCADAFAAGDLFIKETKTGKKRLSGCITWEPKTSEVVEKLDGKCSILTTNKNLLIIADILIVNKHFSEKNPEMIKGLVEGVIYGNTLLRDEPAKHLDVVAKAFDWTIDETKVELDKVHLANLPENKAFFSGTLSSAGSFNYIYETSRLVYGNKLIGQPHESDKIILDKHISEIDKSGIFKGQLTGIEPKRIKLDAAEASEEDAILSKDLQFKFKANKSELDMLVEENKNAVESIKNLLTVSPGSRIVLRGHADGSNLEEHRKHGGEAAVRDAILTLKELSKSRCSELKRVLTEKYNIDEFRISIFPVGPDEPTGKGPIADRRVEVKWLMTE